MFVLLSTNIVLPDEDERLLDRISAEMAAPDVAAAGVWPRPREGGTALAHREARYVLRCKEGSGGRKLMAGSRDEQREWQQIREEHDRAWRLIEEHDREVQQIREAEWVEGHRIRDEEKRVRQRIIAACFALAYRTTKKLAATVVLCATQDGSTLGASMVGWIITREVGEEWLGNTCAEWVDCLFCKANRGYTFLCPRADELLVLQQYLAEQDTGMKLDPVTRKDGALLTLTCSKGHKATTFINAMGVSDTMRGTYIPVYALPSRKQQLHDGDTGALTWVRAVGRGLVDTYAKQPWAIASWQVQAIDAQALPSTVPAPGCVIYALVDPRNGRVRYVG